MRCIQSILTDIEQSNSFLLNWLHYAFSAFLMVSLLYKRGCIKNVLTSCVFSTVYHGAVLPLLWSKVYLGTVLVYCVLQHTLGFHCNLVQNPHVTIATADPIIPAPFKSGLASDAWGCQISSLLLHPNCTVLIINYNRKPYFTMTERVQCSTL